MYLEAQVSSTEPLEPREGSIGLFDPRKGCHRGQGGEDQVLPQWLDDVRRARAEHRTETYRGRHGAAVRDGVGQRERIAPPRVVRLRATLTPFLSEVHLVLRAAFTVHREVMALLGERNAGRRIEAPR